MPSREEILQDLLSIEKSVYRDIIDTSKANGTEKIGTFHVLSNYMTTKKNRTEDLYEAVSEKYKDDVDSDKYAIFREILADISGQEDDLDRINGWISATVFGDVRDQRLRKREINELTILQSLLVDEVLDRINEFEQELDTLKGQIPE